MSDAQAASKSPLLDDWKDVLTGAWSVKVMGALAFLDVAAEIANDVVPVLSGFDLPLWVTLPLIGLAIAARLAKQPAKSE